MFSSARSPVAAPHGAPATHSPAREPLRRIRGRNASETGWKAAPLSCRCNGISVAAANKSQKAAERKGVSGRMYHEPRYSCARPCPVHDCGDP